LIAVENATALGDDVLKIGEGLEVLVGQWLVEDGPEVLGGLKLGGVWGIGVKLASYGIADIRLSFASGMGEASMHVGGGLQEVMESDAADDGDQQHTSGDVPHAPERRGISSVEQVLRGRRPGNPGRGRRTTRPG